MIVGFTGTRHGMTATQLERVRELFADATELHHGDCVGADAQAHAIAVELGLIVIVHPPLDQKLRAHCVPAEGGVLEKRHYHERNADIVRAADVVVACPAEESERWRGSGTWQTIRIARRIGRTLLLVLPDGTVDG